MPDNWGFVVAAYGLAEQAAGLPRLNWFFVTVPMALFWILGHALASRRYR